jgi:hypothetical protein
MLSRLEMEVDTCIAAYIQLMKAMFKEQSSRLPVNWLLVGWLLEREGEGPVRSRKPEKCDQPRHS